MNKIAAAVEPLRQEAMQRAKQEMEKRINSFIERLESADMDRNAVAPAPKSNIGRNAYMTKHADWQFLHSFTKSIKPCIYLERDPANHTKDCSCCGGTGMMDNSSYIHSGPDTCRIEQDRIARILKFTREEASAQYDAFISKLTKKIELSLGGVHPDAVVLRGNHVWGYSFLDVEKLVEGVGNWTETWKTQQITNVSKLGTIFNQWPSRKVK